MFGGISYSEILLTILWYHKNFIWSQIVKSPKPNTYTKFYWFKGRNLKPASIYQKYIDKFGNCKKKNP